MKAGQILFLLSLILSPLVARADTPSNPCTRESDCTIDKRRYVQDWCTPPYDKIVLYRLPLSNGTENICTAQYVAKDIILTALHCIKDGLPTAQITNCHNPRLRHNITLISHGSDIQNADWALYRVDDPAGYSETFFDVAQRTPERINITNAGWGVVRVLSDADIEEIRRQATRLSNSGKSNMDILTALEDYAEANLYEPPRDYDKQLKTNTSCQITGTRPGRPPYFTDTCNTHVGNSGGPYFSDNTLYGIVSGGSFDIQSPTNMANNDYGLKTEVFYSDLLAATNPAPNPAPALNPTPVTADITNNSIPKNETAKPENIQHAIHTQTTAILNDIQKIATASDEDIFNLVFKLSDLEKLKQQYEKAKEREQSTANKLLGAAAIGATGLGMQNLLSGMAEQSADEDAERAMKAYLETFTCDYGQGRNIKGGQMEIELPGATQLFEQVNEYKALATDLKTRKEVLGLRPGIESEVILDKAETGLYDDVGVGITGGAYTSVSRALQDPTGEDAESWAKQNQDTKSKTKTGAITAGAGALGGAVGNLIINRDKGDDKKSTNNTVQ